MTLQNREETKRGLINIGWPGWPENRLYPAISMAAINEEARRGGVANVA